MWNSDFRARESTFLRRSHDPPAGLVCGHFAAGTAELRRRSCDCVTHKAKMLALWPVPGEVSWSLLWVEDAGDLSEGRGGEGLRGRRKKL